ncbi:hypothetical protein ABIE09_000257 [Lysobacter enzymogenes]|uniref:nucleotidyltransferase family protein n=1 Tax=Lysobacter enzymogenes TaxID=69 RepID=UPI0033969645
MPPPEPPLRAIRAGLRLATETLAHELARPADATPRWSPLQWRLAAAAAAAHGVAPLLQRRSRWSDPRWRTFLDEQRAHVEHRHRRVAALLERIDRDARAAGIALVALKGSALHALGVYLPGDRPMADIDLLVGDGDAAEAAALLGRLGYVEAFAHWKHRVFKPADQLPPHSLGEHRDTPINIELHPRVRERLPLAYADISERILAADARPGLNPYPDLGALMSHLLLHAAGNLCGRSLRLIHLNDIALLAARMSARDWQALCDGDGGAAPWWALPPMLLARRYYPDAFPVAVLERLRGHCPARLRRRWQRRDLSAASCSNLWLSALPGLEWARTPGEAARYLRDRLNPGEESRRERADMVRTQLWLQQQRWAAMPQRLRLLTRLLRPVPRMDALYVVRAALNGYDRAAG